MALSYMSNDSIEVEMLKLNVSFSSTQDSIVCPVLDAKPLFEVFISVNIYFNLCSSPFSEYNKGFNMILIYNDINEYFLHLYLFTKEI